MKSSAIVLGIGVAALLMTMPAAASPVILLNGDAESGDLSGWITTDPQIHAVTSQKQSTGTVYPYEGNAFFSFAVSDARDRADDSPVTIGMYQTGTIDDVPNLRLAGRVQTETRGGDCDAGEVVLSVFDMDGGLLASASSGLLTTDNFEWRQFAVELTGLSGAASWRADLYGTVFDGTYVNVFYDDLQLIANPVPGAVILVGIGAGLTGWLRRRRAL
ncbi:MAG: hypothetical protein ABFE13_26065 [Phycisphaerales bacterium]